MFRDGAMTYLIVAMEYTAAALIQGPYEECRWIVVKKSAFQFFQNFLLDQQLEPVCGGKLLSSQKVGDLDAAHEFDDEVGTAGVRHSSIMNLPAPVRQTHSVPATA
jgi:hypothetical protein